MQETYIILVDILLWPLKNTELIDTNRDLFTSSVVSRSVGKVGLVNKLLLVSFLIVNTVVLKLHDEGFSRLKMYESEERKGNSEVFEVE